MQRRFRSFLYFSTAVPLSATLRFALAIQFTSLSLLCLALSKHLCSPLCLLLSWLFFAHPLLFFSLPLPFNSVLLKAFSVQNCSLLCLLASYPCQSMPPLYFSSPLPSFSAHISSKPCRCLFEMPPGELTVTPAALQIYSHGQRILNRFARSAGQIREAGLEPARQITTLLVTYCLSLN